MLQVWQLVLQNRHQLCTRLIKQLAALELQLLESCRGSCAKHTCEAIARQQLQGHALAFEVAELQGAGQLVNVDCEMRVMTKPDTADILSVTAQVQLQAVHLLLIHIRCDAAEGFHSCPVQPAVGPGCAAHDALFASTEAQHQQQTGVWQLQ